MNSINIKQIKTGLTLIDNKFIVSNAALDLGIATESVSGTIKRLIQNSPIELFRYSKRNKRGRGSITGLTKEGKVFFHYGLFLIHSIKGI